MKTHTRTNRDRKPLFWQAGAVILAATLCAPALAGFRAEVLTVDPIIEVVEVEVPHEVCRVESVRQTTVQGSSYGRGGQRSRTPGVVGAIIGGAIGNSVGHGKTNRRIGTAVGAILGGTIGADISRRNHQRSQYEGRGYNSGRNQPASYRTEQVCRVTRDFRTEERINGYAVTYTYAGETYSAVLDHDPGRYLDVNVRVTPTG